MASGVNKWDWNHSSQSGDYFIKKQNKLVHKCLNHKSNWRRLTGFPLYVGFASLSIVRSISLIGEQTIKGVGNLVGAAIPGSKFSAKKGAKQLFLLMPWEILNLIFTPLWAPIFIVGTIAVALAPDAMHRNLIQLTRDEKAINKKVKLAQIKLVS